MRIGANLHGINSSILSSLNKLYGQIGSAAMQLAGGTNSSALNPVNFSTAAKIGKTLVSVTQASTNVAMAQNEMSTADAGMGQALELLDTMHKDVTAAASGTLTDSQRAALQTEVDAALQSLSRIGSNTEYGGQKLLNGGTLTFQISTNTSKTVSIQMPDISTSALGGTSGALSDLASGGSANLQTGDLEKAQDILDQAESQITAAQAKTGAFESYTLDTAANQLDTMKSALTSALSGMVGADLAATTANLVNSQLMAKALVNVAANTLKTSRSMLDLSG
jgi:flagellin